MGDVEYTEEYIDLQRNRNALRNVIKDLQGKVVRLRAEVRELHVFSDDIRYSDDSEREGKTKELGVLESFMQAVDAKVSHTFVDQVEAIQGTGLRVTVKFQSSQVKFYVGKETTFEDLSLKSANYWGIQKDSIFFTQEGQTQIITPTDMVISYVLAWGRYLPRTHQPTFTLVLSGSREVQELFEEFDRFSEVDFAELDMTFAHRQEEPTKSAIGQVFHRRLRKNLILNILQLAFTFTLFVSWAAILIIQQYPGEPSWMSTYLFEVINEDQTLTRSKLYPELVNATPTINTPQEFWDYIERQQSALNFGGSGHTEKLAPSIYVYEAIQLRQLRSTERMCDHSEYGKVPCPQPYSHDPSSEDVSDADGFTYDSDGSAVLIPGTTDWYTGAGMKMDLLTTDQTEWNSAVGSLVQNGWIQSSTRVLFVAFNVVNPTLSLLNTFVFFLEISSNDSYTPNFSSFMFNYARLDAQFIIWQSMTIFFSVSLLWLEARLMLMSDNEATQTSKFPLKQVCSFSGKIDSATESRYQSMLDQWAMHSRKSVCSRLRRAGFGDKLNLASLASGLLLQITYGALLSSMKSAMDVASGEYTDLYSKVYMIAIVTDLMLISLIVLGIRISRQLLRWVASLHKYYDAWTSAIASAAAIAILFYLLTFGYSIVSYFLFGPYLSTSSQFSTAFISTMSLALGNFEYQLGLEVFIGGFSVTMYLLIVRATVYGLVLLVCSMFMAALLDLYAKKVSNKEEPPTIKPLRSIKAV